MEESLHHSKKMEERLTQMTKILKINLVSRQEVDN